MKIAHEAPLSIFDKVQEVTDYDYALVHMFEENKAYFDVFVKALENGREVILDNSIFELGEAFDAKKYAWWVDVLRPTYYIIPDVLEDCDGTIRNFDSWMENYSHRFRNVKTIAVAQGKSYNEVIRCYEYLVDKVDKIAISFDYSFFESWYANMPTKYHAWCAGRQELLETMVHHNVIRKDKPHHLLGCSLPQEFKKYKKYEWIDSVDTSSPVVHGIKNITYAPNQGLNNKQSVKLFTLMEEEVVDSWNDILYNINEFRGYCNVNI